MNGQSSPTCRDCGAIAPHTTSENTLLSVAGWRAEIVHGAPGQRAQLLLRCPACAKKHREQKLRALGSKRPKPG